MASKHKYTVTVIYWDTPKVDRILCESFKIREENSIFLWTGTKNRGNILIPFGSRVRRVEIIPPLDAGKAVVDEKGKS